MLARIFIPKFAVQNVEKTLKKMATLSLTIFKTRADKKGRCVIYISVCVKSRRAYINTGIKCEPSHFKNGRIVRDTNAAELNQELNNMLYNYEKKLRSIECNNILNPNALKEILVSKEREHKIKTFNEVVKKYIKLLTENSSSPATIHNYHTMQESFITFHKVDISLSELNNDIIMSYVRFLQKNRAPGGVQFIMGCFKRIIHYAEEKGWVKYDISPFLGVKIAKSQPRTLDITPDEMLAVKESDRYAGDILLLSFYLGGINYKDLVKVDLSGDILEYSRSKTEKKTGGEKTIITIPPEAKEIIKRIGLDDGKLRVRNKAIAGLTSVNSSLKCIAKKFNIKSRISYYSARKSFVQYGVQLGVPLYILEYCIGQTMKTNRPIYNYFRIIQPQADAAIRRIIDYMLSGGKDTGKPFTGTEIGQMEQ